MAALGYKVAPLPSYDNLRAVFEQASTADDLAEVVQTIIDLGDDAGRDAILDAARDQGIDTTTWDGDESSQDLAARTWIESRSDERVANILARALVEVHELKSTRRHQEFCGREALPIDGRKQRDVLRRKVVAWCEANQRGDHAEVRVYRDRARTIFQLIHGHRIVAPLVVEESGRKVLRHRPAHFDHVEYDETNGALKISSQSRELIGAYKVIFGEVLFKDSAFFDSDDVCTLWPLQEKGRTALEQHGLGEEIDRVLLVSCVWKHGDDRFVINGPDCFEAIRRKFNAPLQEGELVEAKLALRFSSGKPRRVVVTIKVPNRIAYRRDIRRDDLIERYLRQIGVRSTSDKSRRHLWTLAEGGHPLEVWKTLEGPHVDELVENGVLKQLSRQSAQHANFPKHGDVLVAHSIDEGHDRYGVSVDPDVPSRTLTLSDRDGLRFDAIAFGKALATDLELDGGVQDIDRGGAIYLGSRDLGTTPRVAVVLLSRAPQDRAFLADVLYQKYKQAKLVVLVPSGAEGLPGNARIQLDSLSGPHKHLLAKIISELGIEDSVPAQLRAPPGHRLVIDKKTQEIFTDGVKLRIERDTQPHKFIMVLAGAHEKNAKLETKDIAALLSPNANSDNVARQAKSDAIKKLKQSFAAEDREVPPDLLKIFDGYRINVPTFIG